jgi:hypothetical protein
VDSGEVEGKTKMAFAKMHVPHPFREQFLLSDEDFKMKSDKDEEEALTASVSQESEAASNSINWADGGDPVVAANTSASGSKKSSRATTPGIVVPNFSLMFRSLCCCFSGRSESFFTTASTQILFISHWRRHSG